MATVARDPDIDEASIRCRYQLRLSHMDTFRANPYAMSESIDRLQSPLIRYMLPHLPAASIASIRSSCTSFQHLVDNAPHDAIQPALCSVLPALLVRSADTMAALQDELHRHAASMARLRSCDIQQMQQVPFKSTLHPERQPFEEVLWHPSSRQAILIRMRDKMALFDASNTSGNVQQLVNDLPEGIRSVEWQIRLRDDYLLCMCGVQTSALSCLITKHLPTGATSITPMLQKHFLLQMSHKDLVSPSGDSILVWPLQRCAFAMLSLPSLEMQFQVPFPASGSSNPQTSTQKWDADKAQWSSSGAHFAVLWELDCEPPVSHLTIHAAHGGACLSIIELGQALGWQSSHFPLDYLSWCPDQAEILVARRFQLADADSCSPIGIISLDGSVAVLPVQNPLEELRLSWSPCGRFLQSTQAIRAERSLRQASGPDTGTSELGAISSISSGPCVELQMEGCIWDARTLQKVFTWESPHTQRLHRFPCYDSATWSQQGGLCCIGRPRMLICLPTAGSQDAVVSFPWLEAENDDGRRMKCPCSGTKFFFSPCGKVLLAIGPIGMPSSGPCRAAHQHASGQATIHGVWHGYIDVKACTCKLHLVGEIHVDPAALQSQRKLPQCIAWHPSPSVCMYALVDVHGIVSLMDRNGNKIVSLLDLELAQPDQLPAAVPVPTELARSETTASSSSAATALEDQDDGIQGLLPITNTFIAAVTAITSVEEVGNNAADDGGEHTYDDGKCIDHADPRTIDQSLVTLDWCPDGELLLVGQRGAVTLLQF